MITDTRIIREKNTSWLSWIHEKNREREEGGGKGEMDCRLEEENLEAGGEERKELKECLGLESDLKKVS